MLCKAKLNIVSRNSPTILFTCVLFLHQNAHRRDSMNRGNALEKKVEALNNFTSHNDVFSSEPSQKEQYCWQENVKKCVLMISQQKLSEIIQFWASML